MLYSTPTIVVYTEQEIDEIIVAAACGSQPGSCYGGCNGQNCNFSVQS